MLLRLAKALWKHFRNLVLLQVHLCEVVNMNEMIGDDFLVNRTRGGTGTLGKTSSMRVVVKTLKKNADENAR